MLAEVISDMNSNYENRKHGGNSQVFSMEEKMLSALSEIGIENIFASAVHVQLSEKIESGTLEHLKSVVSEYQGEVVLENNSRKLS